MSKQKTERLLSLVVCLLSSRRYLTAGQIREAVPGYPENFEAFKRMFERDKDELRELGIPLETGSNARPEDEAGYRISRQAYELPEIMLEPDEAAVLGLAARVWQRAALEGAAAGGLLKLRAAGIDAQEGQAGIEPRLQTQEPAFSPLWRAVRDRRPVQFSYRAAGRSAAQARNLEPWGVVNRNGIWYVAGFDRDRGEERVFRLSRIEGDVTFAGPPGSVEVPAGTDVRKAVREGDGAPPKLRTAELKIRSGTGYGLRRRALSDKPYPAGNSAACGAEQWDLVKTSFSDAVWYADYLASFGADVIVLEPVDLREAVIRKLKGVLA